jgi:hypothetical protein
MKKNADFIRDTLILGDCHDLLQVFFMPLKTNMLSNTLSIFL